MLRDFTHGYKAPKNHKSWLQALEAADAMRRVMMMECKNFVTGILKDEQMTAAVRKHMNVSERHTITRRHAFNWLLFVYEKAVETGQNEMDWTTTLHLWPSSSGTHILLEQHGMMNCAGALWEHIEGLKEFGVPGPSPQSTLARKTFWRDISTDFHYELPVMTPETFRRFAQFASDAPS